ncbi:hypothetical protein I3A86_24045, partial [Salmonella enterica]|nr:hypothetical protein [Salmonella enterica]
MAGGPSFASPRLRFAPFTMDDAAEVHACITPEVARFMRWDPPPSFEAFRARRLAEARAADRTDRSFVVRRRDT